MEDVLLSWKDICERYPKQSVALTEVKLSNKSTIVLAKVLYSEKKDKMTPSEIAGIAMMSGGSIVAENTSDSILSAGASVSC